MSGIMAILSLDGRPVPPELARKQLAAIAQRGEWEPRLWEADGVALGHVNLPRTPEADRELLPGSDSTGRYWITWDGRLDNRHELAGLLGLDSAQEAAMTDADYVLAAYQRWDAECVHKLLGDWAIVIWDSRERKLFCAKDPLGWRQLYYAERDGLLAVGSEPQQLFAGEFMRRAVNNEYVLRHVGLAFQVAGETCFSGVRAIQGGDTMSCVGGKVSAGTFWRPPEPDYRRFRRPEEVVDEFVRLFAAATAARLRANRGIAVFLSGGLDSSYIAGVASSQGRDVTAITAFAPETKAMDERRYAELIVRRFGLRQIEVDITDCWSLSSAWVTDEMFDQPEHPFQSSAQVRLTVTARDAAVGVVLGGEGGDEWMTGVEGFISNAVLHRHSRAAVRIAARANLLRPRKALAATVQAYVPQSMRDAARRCRRRTVASAFPQFVTPSPAWESVVRPPSLAWEDSARRRDHWKLYRQTAEPLAGWRERHAGNPNGVELRSPFNDLRVVELMSLAPTWMKWHDGRTKSILRDAEYRLLPKEIPDRTDAGLYNELVHSGVCKEELPRTRRSIDALACIDGLNLDMVRQEIGGWIAQPSRYAFLNWNAVTTGLWLRSFNASRTERIATRSLNRKEVIAR